MQMDDDTTEEWTKANSELIMTQKLDDEIARLYEATQELSSTEKVELIVKLLSASDQAELVAKLLSASNKM